VARLAHNTYGKSRVRLTKVVRRPDGVHRLYEYSVDIRLEGEFERVYTHGDNAACIPTDTMKNTVYALAKRNDFDCPEFFGMVLSGHFREKFPHVSAATASIEQTLWERIPVAGRPHAHSFVRASSAVRTAVVRQQSGRIDLTGGVRNLEVIKTTRSGFTGFLKDEYTTLKETTDRIFGTSIEAAWTFSTMVRDFNAVFDKLTTTILEVFATHDSLGVQHTIFAMGEAVLAAVPAISEVRFRLPNQHRILVPLEAFHLSNDHDIFVATSEPFGLIEGTITRE
jgi:urate oxidase